MKFSEWLLKEGKVVIKPNYSGLKKWYNTVNNNVDGKAPKDWHVDNFKSFIRGEIDYEGILVDKKMEKLLGFPKNFIMFNMNTGGSGLNNNKNFNKYDNWFSALYDIWEDIQKNM